MPYRREVRPCMVRSHTGLRFHLPLGGLRELTVSSLLSRGQQPDDHQTSQRLALIDAFKKQSEGLQNQFEARSYKSEWTMPYRLFRPQSQTAGKLPLVLYLHG